MKCDECGDEVEVEGERVCYDCRMRHFEIKRENDRLKEIDSDKRDGESEP